MLDFLYITEEEVQKRAIGESYIRIIPGFKAIKSKDLMIRGGVMYAVWDESQNTWSSSIYDLVRIVDQAIQKYIENMPADRAALARPEYLVNENNLRLSSFHRFCKNLDDNFTQLDQKIIFANETPKREDYSTYKLDYSPEKGSITCYRELMSVLFAPIELHKLEWAIGAILSGHRPQKFVALYGAPGSGKSTYLDLIERLMGDYSETFKASELGNSSRQFALETFKRSPLVAVDHDASLANIEDNTTLNMIVSHDTMLVNEKHKSQYSLRLNTFLFIGTNKFVKITDSFSGLIRRLIDVHPTGYLHSPEAYHRLVEGMEFELGAIAHHCIKIFRNAGPNYYSGYVPTRMIYGTNALHNFVDQHRFDFEEAEYTTLKQAFALYRVYMEESNERFVLSQKEFREELKAYFKDFKYRDQALDGRPTNVYTGFKSQLFESDETPKVIEEDPVVEMDATVSLVDKMLEDRPAQYANSYGTPAAKWDSVKTTLSDLDTTKLHYVKPPLNHIVVDFDLTDEEGNKSRERNLEAISHFPPTYAEFSKSGSGIHLHYLYSGDPERLSRVYGPGIEVKVFVGNSSLRRMYSTSNTLPVATLTSGLPIREEKVLDQKEVKSENGLRRLIQKNLMKQIHPGTKPSMDFIHKILNDAYKSDLVYDLSDMKKAVVTFAMNSTNQSEYCLKLIKDIPFKSEEERPDKPFPAKDKIVFFDCEVYPNLFVIRWKYHGESELVSMVNPTPAEVGELFELKLAGFYNRKYDNHILYARWMGYDNERLYQLSQRLVANERSPFVAAYNISYLDIYDMLSKKQSLKKWQLELGIRHMELSIPWDEPVPDELIDKVLEYCGNDVTSLEAVFDSRKEDFMARQILSDLSGLTVNNSTNSHSTRIIFGSEKNPQKEFVYTHLDELFPGYEFDFGKSKYRGMNPSEGGFVYSEPGMYQNVRTWDVQSMHPNSIIALNLFGTHYTKRFAELVEARVAIKQKDYDKAGKLLGGKLQPYLSDPKQARGLSDALKIVINSVYGLTSASFDNAFRDPRNVDNIVAKRGALFMIDILLYLQDLGYEVVHIKTDSVKIANPDDKVDGLIKEFGTKYGYIFETHETDDFYEKFCLVNDAVFIGQHPDGSWEAVGAQFKHPYVYKTLFSKEPVVFDDFIEVKSVQTSLWLEDEDGTRHFIGRVGAFVPVISGGFDLKRQGNNDTYSYASGTKGHKWKEADLEQALSGGRYDNIDMTYFDGLVNKAVDQLAKFGDAEWMLG